MRLNGCERCLLATLSHFIRNRHGSRKTASFGWEVGTCMEGDIMCLGKNDCNLQKLGIVIDYLKVVCSEFARF